MRRASGHRVRTAAHHVLLFVQKPGGMSGPARGPGKVLPLHGGEDRGHEGEVGHRRRPVPVITWILIALGVIVLALAIVLGIQIGRQLVGWFRV